MKKILVIAVLGFGILYGFNTNSLAENGRVQFVVDGNNITLGEETKQKILKTLVSAIPQCESDSRTNANTWLMPADKKAGWEQGFEYDHFHIAYDEPVEVTRNGDTIEILELLVRIQDLNPDRFNKKAIKDLSAYRVEIYSRNNEDLIGFGQCDDFLMNALCDEEILKHFSGKGFPEKCAESKK